MSFAKKLSEAMSERQMSQTELAEKIGKNKSSVSQYLSGRSIPRPAVQEKIAATLDCTVDWLNEEDNEPSGKTNGVRNITVAQCAKLLGKSEQFVRVSLQQRTAPFGFATKIKTKYSYQISPKLLYEYIERENQQVI